MKLIKAHITNFRSVEDSEPFKVDQVTCLVGKNEAGKSALLLALAALNPHPSTRIALDKERDYPRRYLTAFSERHKDGSAVAVSTEWQLSGQELQSVADELGPGVLTNPVVTVSRSYGSKAAEIRAELNLTTAIDNALANCGFDDTQIASLRSSKNTKGLVDKAFQRTKCPTPQSLKRIGGLCPASPET